MHIRNELSSPVTTWFKYLYKNDITCPDSKSTLALTPLSAMQCIFPSENLQAECPNQCLCSYAPYQSHQDLKGRDRPSFFVQVGHETYQNDEQSR